MVVKSEESLRGICIDCDRVFKIPSADRVYTCKACGGEVHAEDELETFEDESWDEEDDDYEEDDEPRLSPAEERQRHRREMQVFRRLNQLRSGFLVAGPLAALTATIYWFMLPSMIDTKLRELVDIETILTQAGQLQIAAAVVTSVASLLIWRSPTILSWSSALVQSAAAGVAWVAYTQGGYQLWALFFTILAVVQWGAVFVVGGEVGRAMSEHPHLIEDLEDEVASHARQRHEEKPVAHWKPPAIAWSATVLIAVGGFYAFKALTAKPTYAATSEKFVSTFGRGDMDAMARYFSDPGRMRKPFAEYAEHRGWIESGWPALSESDVFERRDSAYVTYAGAGDPLIAIWQRIGEEWKLGGFGKKNEVYQEVEETLRAHAETWRDKYRELAVKQDEFLPLVAAGDEAGLAEKILWPAFGDPITPVAEALGWKKSGWPTLTVADTNEPPISLFGGDIQSGLQIEVRYRGAAKPIVARWIQTSKGWGLSSFGTPVVPTY